MENQRVFLAIALSFAVLLAWQLLFSPSAPQAPVGSDAPVSAPTPPTRVEPVQADAEPMDATVRRGDGRTIRVITPQYSVAISEHGAAFTSFTLNDYRTTVEQDSKPLDLIEESNKRRTARIGMDNNRIAGLADAVFRADSDSEEIQVHNERRSLSMTWQNDAGVQVTRTFTFDPSSYVIDHTVTLRNGSSTPLDGSLYFQLYGTDGDDTQSYGFTGPSLFINGSLEQVKPSNVDEENTFSGVIDWSAIQTRYFMNTVIPRSDGPLTVRLAQDDKKRVINRLHQAVSLPIGHQVTIDHQLYFGPKDSRILRTVDHHLDRAVDYGMFDMLAKPCVWLMNQIYRIIPNYGVAIIILTLLVKTLLWPLGNKSYKSMNQMKKMQPLMTEIREKFKNDKKRMNEEMMRLYKTYKVNPMGGCLPMILQIPVFFALYRMLYEAIELRHAPFVGWINDLSAPDRLFHFNIAHLPLIQPPYGIPVLTLIMGATMLLQQKMSPPAGDPTQAKMMMLMPVVFTFIFINFPSGLVLYWLTNNVFSIAQQYLVQKRSA